MFGGRAMASFTIDCRETAFKVGVLDLTAEIRALIDRGKSRVAERALIGNATREAHVVSGIISWTHCPTAFERIPRNRQFVDAAVGLFVEVAPGMITRADHVICPDTHF